MVICIGRLLRVIRVASALGNWIIDGSFKVPTLTSYCKLTYFSLASLGIVTGQSATGGQFETCSHSLWKSVLGGYHLSASLCFSLVCSFGDVIFLLNALSFRQLSIDFFKAIQKEMDSPTGDFGQVN